MYYSVLTTFFSLLTPRVFVNILRYTNNV